MPVCDTPQDHDSTSISPACLRSFDSPLMSPSFKNTSTAIVPLLSCHVDIAGHQRRGRSSRDQLAFADGSFDTSRSDTVRPSSW